MASTQSAAPRSRRLTPPGRGPVLAALSIAAIGLWVGALSAALPALQARVGIDNTGLGLLLLVGSGGALPGTLVLGPFLCRLQSRGLMVACVLSALAMLLVGLAPDAASLCLALVAANLVVASVDVVCNAVLVAHERRLGRQVLQLAHGAFPVPALVASIATGALLTATTGLAIAFAAVGAGFLAVAVANARTVSPRVERPQTRAGIPARRWHPLLSIAAFGFLAFCVESGLANWSADTLVQSQHASGFMAALGPAAHMLGLTLARVIEGARASAHRLGSSRAGALFVLTGVLGVVVAPTAWVALAGFLVAGFGVATWAPAMFSLSGHAAHGLGSRTFMGITTTAAYLGGMLMPGVVGVVAGVGGIRSGMATLLIPAAGAGILLLAPASIRAMGWRSATDRAPAG